MDRQTSGIRPIGTWAQSCACVLRMQSQWLHAYPNTLSVSSIFRKPCYDRTEYRAFSQEREWTARPVASARSGHESNHATAYLGQSLTDCMHIRTHHGLHPSSGNHPILQNDQSSDLYLRSKELTAGRCSVVPLPKQIRVPSSSFNTFINKKNQAPIGPISRTMGQATGGRLL